MGEAPRPLTAGALVSLLTLAISAVAIALVVRQVPRGAQSQWIVDAWAPWEGGDDDPGGPADDPITVSKSPVLAPFLRRDSANGSGSFVHPGNEREIGDYETPGEEVDDERRAREAPTAEPPESEVKRRGDLDGRGSASPSPAAAAVPRVRRASPSSSSRAERGLNPPLTTGPIPPTATAAGRVSVPPAVVMPSLPPPLPAVVHHVDPHVAAVAAAAASAAAAAGGVQSPSSVDPLFARVDVDLAPWRSRASSSSGSAGSGAVAESGSGAPVTGANTVDIDPNAPSSSSSSGSTGSPLGDAGGGGGVLMSDILATRDFDVPLIGGKHRGSGACVCVCVCLKECVCVCVSDVDANGDVGPHRDR